MKRCVADTGSGDQIPDQQRTDKSLRGIRDDESLLLDVSVKADRALVKLQGADGNLAGTGILFGFEADLLSVDETANVGPLQRSGVHEDVIAAFVRRDEAEAFLAVVEFDCTLFHEAVFHCRMHITSRRRTARPDM